MKPGVSEYPGLSPLQALAGINDRFPLNHQLKDPSKNEDRTYQKVNGRHNELSSVLTLVLQELSTILSTLPVLPLGHPSHLLL